MPPTPSSTLPDRTVLWRYQLYKTGTDKLVDWILDTAISVGYGDPNNRPKPPVAVKKLLKCADAITTRMPLVHIPGSMIDLTDDVIRGRQVYAQLFSASRAEGQRPDAGDISHQHFIEALRTIHTQLKDARKRQKAENLGVRHTDGVFATPPATPASPTKPSQFALPRERSLQSLFKHLEVDEPTAQPFSTPEKEKQKPAAPATAKPKVAIDPVAESRFALICFLEDMADLHSFVRDLWDEVVTGKVSVDCATQVTENVFGCMRRAQYTLIDTFHELGMSDTTGHFLSLVKMANSIRTQSQTTVVIGECDRLIWDQTHLLCLDATLIACEAINECRRYHEIKKKRGGKYVASDVAVQLGELHPFAKALFEVLPDLHLVAEPTDEYASVLFPHDGTFDMQLCTAMMTQSYMDIYDIVGCDGVEAMLANTLSQTLKRLEHDIELRDNTMNFIVCPPSFGRPDTLLSILVRERKYLAQLQSPNLSATKSRVAAVARIARTLPVGAGEHVKFCKWLINQTSCPIANDGFVLLGLAHLYRACRYFGLLNTEWPDMEWLIQLQSQTRSFVLEVAEHADEFAWSRHYKIAFGVPPEYIKKINVSRITEGMRKVETQLLWPKLGEVLAKAEEVLGFERGDMAEEVLHQIADRVYAKDKDKKGRRGEARYTSLELLTAFKHATIHDELELNFSYVSFWSTNAKLLHEMSVLLRDRIPQMLQENAMGADFEIVHPLLKEAGLSIVANEPLAGTQLALAAAMIEKHIKAVGDKFTSESRALSSKGAGGGICMGK